MNSEITNRRIPADFADKQTEFVNKSAEGTVNSGMNSEFGMNSDFGRTRLNEFKQI
jgi:hypothetical protein